MAPLLRRYRRRVLALIVAAVLALVVLPRLGVPPTSILSGTIVALAVVSVLQTLLATLAEGEFLAIEGLWEEGDTLTVAGPAGPITGTVVRHLPRVTMLRVSPTQTAVVPHSVLFSAVLLLGPVCPTDTASATTAAPSILHRLLTRRREP